MPAVDVALIRGVDDLLASRGNRNVFYLEFTWCQQSRSRFFRTRHRKRIEMCPAIFLPRKHDVVITRPEDLIITDDIAKYAPLSFVGFPEFATRTRHHIGDANGPWLTGTLRSKSKCLTRG